MILLYKQFKKKVILALIMFLIVNIVGMYLIKVYEKNFIQFDFSDELYYSESEGNVELYQQLIDGLVSDDEYKLLEGQVIYLPSLKYIDETSNYVIKKINSSISRGYNNIVQRVYESNFEALKNNNININLEHMQISNVLVGNYPQDGEVLISEIYALNLIEELNLKSYTQLIFKEIEVDNVVFKISGVYTPTEFDTFDNIIISTNKQLKVQGYLTTEKTEFGFNYFVKTNFTNILFIFGNLLFIMLFYITLRSEIMSIVNIFWYYHRSSLNFQFSIVLFLVFTLICNIVILKYFDL